MTARTEQDKLTRRLRTKRAAIKDNRTADRAANVSQLAARIRDLEAAVLAMARLLVILTDPTDADLTDDDA